MLERPSYLRDGTAIYERSFAIIRAEADLARFSPEEAEVAVRMIHACGQVDIAEHIRFSPGLVTAARGSPARRRADPVRCRDGGAWRHPRAPARQQRGDLHACGIDACRSSPLSSAPPARRPRWSSGAIGWQAPSSPSAMRRRRCSTCSRCSTDGAPKPAAILGIPVGFVGAAESKDALAANASGVPYPDRARPRWAAAP